MTDVSYVQGDGRGGGVGASAMFKPMRGTRAVSHDNKGGGG